MVEICWVDCFVTALMWWLIIMRAWPGEVDDLGVAVLRHHDVARLQIAMDDARRVRLGEAVGGLREIAEQRFQVGAVRVVVDDVGEAAPSTSSIAM